MYRQTLEAQYLSASVCLYLPHQVELKLCSCFMENSMSMSVHIIINFCYTTKVYDNTLSSVSVGPSIPPPLPPHLYTSILYIYRELVIPYLWPNIPCALILYTFVLYGGKSPTLLRYSFMCRDKLIATTTSSNQKNLFIILFGRQKQSQKWYIVVSFSYYYGSRIENAIPYNFMVRPSIILFELSLSLSISIVIDPVVHLWFFKNPTK